MISFNTVYALQPFDLNYLQNKKYLTQDDIDLVYNEMSIDCASDDLNNAVLLFVCQASSYKLVKTELEKIGYDIIENTPPRIPPQLNIISSPYFDNIH